MADPLDLRIERLIRRANEIIAELDHVRAQLMTTGGGSSARTDELISRADALMAELDAVVKRMADLLTGKAQEDDDAPEG